MPEKRAVVIAVAHLGLEAGLALEYQDREYEVYVPFEDTPDVLVGKEIQRDLLASGKYETVELILG